MIFVQTLITGILLGALYAVFALGLNLTWGLLRTINFAHFAFVFLSAYVTYELATTADIDPLLTFVVTIPLGIVLAVVLQAFISVTRLDTFGSLIVTFGMFLVVEAILTLIWSNDLVRISLDDNPYFISAIQVGPFTVPLLSAVAAVGAALLCGFAYWFLVRTYAGKGIRALVQDPEMATAFGVNSTRLAYAVAAISGASIAVAGSLVGMLYVLTPAEAETWVGAMFAVVLLGGLGNPLGVVGAALIVALAETFTRQFADPSMARLTSLVLLVIVILFRPQGLFKPAVAEGHE